MSSTILIADDSRTMRQMVRTALEADRHHVLEATDGRAALDAAGAVEADLVITDVNMPEMDGIDMAAAIKSTKSDTKFIVLTAYNEKRFFQKFSEIGFSAYLLKPIEFKKLFAAIEKCMEDISAQKK
jgi:YesN/AraC family two-component response regulator